MIFLFISISRDDRGKYRSVRKEILGTASKADPPDWEKKSNKREETNPKSPDQNCNELTKEHSS